MDLPGYGYAKCSKAEREKWAKLIEAYISGNSRLKAVAVLLDSRLTPQKLDLELTSYLRGLGIPVIPVLTKADKPKQTGPDPFAEPVAGHPATGPRPDPLFEHDRHGRGEIVGSPDELRDLMTRNGPGAGSRPTP